jgi:multimeric flavodoxin WrbA
MSKIAIIYHSGYGHTKVIANHIKKGIEGENATCKMYSAGDFVDGKSPLFAELATMDCIVFGCPTYMGSASAGLKAFMEASSGEWFKQNWKDKFAAGFTVSGAYSGDKEISLIQIMSFASQHSMIWISQGIMSTGKTEDDVNRLGSYIGLMAQADNGAPEITPPIGDKKTAEMFGKRIAEVVNKSVK